MTNILIIYSSKDGQTLKICQKLQSFIEKAAHPVSLVSIEDTQKIDFDDFDKIILGASIHYGRHNALIYDFIEKNLLLLNSKPNAFFSVNIVARKPNKNSPDTNPYLRKFLKQIKWKPKILGVFAGKLDYPSYTPLDRLMIRMIMWITKGPTDPDSVIEFTDWDQVESFAKIIIEM